MRSGIAANPTIPVLILGCGITALGVQRTLVRADIPYYLADDRDPLLRRSRWFRPLPFAARRLDPGELARWLDESPLDAAVLIPCSDGLAMEVASLDEGLCRRFPASIPSPDTLECVVDKGRFAQSLAEFGVPHPWTKVMRQEGDLEDVPEERLATAFLKPRDSQMFFQTFGVKAFKPSSRCEAATRFAEATAAGFGMIFQDYVPGPPTNHFFVDGFVDGYGEVRALFARQRLRMYPPLFGNSTYMKSVALKTVAEAVEPLRRFLRGIAYRGVFSAEFKLDARDGVFRILEINARPWWFVEFAARCGVDVCSMSYDDALGREARETRDYVVGRRCVHPYWDYFACRDLRRAGELGFLGGLMSWTGAVQPVFQWNDPWPAVGTSARMTARKLSKAIRRRG